MKMRLALLLALFVSVSTAPLPSTTTYSDDDDLSFSGIVSTIGRQLLHKGANKISEYVDSFLGRNTDEDGRDDTVTKSSRRIDDDDVDSRREKAEADREPQHGGRRSHRPDIDHPESGHSLSEKFAESDNDDGVSNRESDRKNFRSRDRL